MVKSNIPVRKTYVVSEHTPLKSKKSRSKESKETKQIFERIAKVIADENSIQVRLQLETFCKDIIQRNFSDVRNDLALIESSLLARISQVESKINNHHSKLQETQIAADKFDAKIEEVQSAFKKSLVSGFDNERAKRLSFVKKFQSQQDQFLSHHEKIQSDYRRDISEKVDNISQDIVSSSKIIADTKFKVDEM